MAAQGWIKLHRCIIDNWVWDCEFSYGQAWIDLLMKACHKPNKLMIKGQMISLERGQQARSEVTLAKEWKWSRGKVRRFLSRLEGDSMIVHQTDNLTSIITICNYDSFQGGDTADDTADGTADGQQTVHKQEVKKLRSEEVKEVDKKGSQSLDFSSWPSMPSDQLMDEWKALRKRLKAGITQTVVNRTGKELHLAVKAGFTVEQCFEQWIYKGWRGFEASWITGGQKAASQQPVKKTPRAFGE